MRRATSAALSATAWWLTTMSTTWPRLVLYTCAQLTQSAWQLHLHPSAQRPNRDLQFKARH